MRVLYAKIRGPTPAQATRVVQIIPTFKHGRILTYKHDLHRKESMPGLLLSDPPLRKSTPSSSNRFIQTTPVRIFAPLSQENDQRSLLCTESLIHRFLKTTC